MWPPNIVVRLPKDVNSHGPGVQRAPINQHSSTNAGGFLSFISDTTGSAAAMTPTECTIRIDDQMMSNLQQPLASAENGSSNVAENNYTSTTHRPINTTANKFDGEDTTQRIEALLSAMSRAKRAMVAMESVLQAKRESLQHGPDSLPSLKKLDVAVSLDKQIKAALPMLQGLVSQMTG